MKKLPFFCKFLQIKGQMTSTNIEVGIIGKDQIFRVLTPNEIKDYLDEVE